MIENFGGIVNFLAVLLVFHLIIMFNMSDIIYA